MSGGDMWGDSTMSSGRVSNRLEMSDLNSSMESFRGSGYRVGDSDVDSNL